jgi:hypothetical protein
MVDAGDELSTLELIHFDLCEMNGELTNMAKYNSWHSYMMLLWWCKSSPTWLKGDNHFLEVPVSDITFFSSSWYGAFVAIDTTTYLYGFIQDDYID